MPFIEQCLQLLMSPVTRQALGRGKNLDPKMQTLG